MSIFFHEQLYRSRQSMAKLRDYPVAICGAGALGANIAETLARSGFGKLKVIDCDRIEERNLSTQPYYRSDIGAFKAKILANNLYRAIGVHIEAETKRLTATNTKQLLGQSSLVIDAFDNSASRQAVKNHCDRTGQPCLHAGLASDYAEVIWNDLYRVPSDVNDDVCDYPLARNLVLLTVAIACESSVGLILSGNQRSFTITLKDLSIQAIQ
jgi:molybdopterin-synthase adenylyltransferase